MTEWPPPCSLLLSRTRSGWKCQSTFSKQAGSSTFFARIKKKSYFLSPSNFFPFVSSLFPLAPSVCCCSRRCRCVRMLVPRPTPWQFQSLKIHRSTVPYKAKFVDRRIFWFRNCERVGQVPRWDHHANADKQRKFYLEANPAIFDVKVEEEKAIGMRAEEKSRMTLCKTQIDDEKTTKEFPLYHCAHFQSSSNRCKYPPALL